jgi:hypothetical protein
VADTTPSRRKPKEGEDVDEEAIGDSDRAAAAGVLAVGAQSTAARSQAKDPIFGRWQQTHECAWLLHALKEDNLRRIAPSVVGDYFPNKTPQQLASKRHIC